MNCTFEIDAGHIGVHFARKQKLAIDFTDPKVPQGGSWLAPVRAAREALRCALYRAARGSDTTGCAAHGAAVST